MYSNSMAHLILVRHGKSEWNKLGLWTGWNDVSLVEEGIEEARRAGEAIKDFSIDAVHISDLKRAHETWHEIQGVISRPDLQAKSDAALKERSYGIYAGKNKWDIQKQIGDDEFKKLRRSWDHPVPEGETMKDVHARTTPYYESYILPELKAGKNVLVVAHGNSLRALVKRLENIPDDKVSELEIGTGEVYVYDVDENGMITGKEIRAANAQKGKV